MAKKVLFRAALFGGYNKEDVHEYIQTLENEIEAVKVLNQKEKNGLQRQLDESREQKAEENEQLLKMKEQLDHSRSRLKEKEEELNGKLEELEKCRTESKELEEELRKSQEAAKGLEEELKTVREELAARHETEDSGTGYTWKKTGADGDEEGQADSAQAEKIRLLNENAELKVRLESLSQELKVMEERQSSVRDENDEDFFDYRTVTKIIEEAHQNAELILEDARKEGEQIVEKAVEDAEKQKGVIAARINMELEEKGIKLIAAKHKIDQYMKEVHSAQQGLFNIYTRMNQLISKMPVRLDDYWDGEHYKVLEKMRETEREAGSETGTETTTAESGFGAEETGKKEEE